MQKNYCDYKSYMIDRYGHALFRIPIDLGLGCPNREADGSGGCSFCPTHGARAQQTVQSESIEEQVADAIQFATRRYRAKKFAAYFQAYTSTFAPQSEQRQLFERVLRAHPFDAIFVGTRPDCLDDDTLDFLCELNKTTEVWVELGVQTAHDATLARVNRGHDWASSERAIRLLKERGLSVAAHIILGLPGETAAQASQTADALAQLPIDGVKIHNLHIIKDTQLAREYSEAPFPVLAPFEYAEQVIDFMRRMPARIPIMRMQTDTPDAERIAPNWLIEKGQFIEYVDHQLHFREQQQGDLFDTATARPSPVTPQIKKTGDESITFFSPDFKEHYHSPTGARQESLGKFIEPSGILSLAKERPIQLLDVCFGLGYNSLLTLEQAGQHSVQPLTIHALEIDRRIIRQAAEQLPQDPNAAFDWNQALFSLYQTGRFQWGGHQIILHIGDARYTLPRLDAEFDIVFLDAFSTQRNAELWTVEFLTELHKKMTSKATLLTYCAALPVRSGMREAGFQIGETAPIGRTRGGTIASKSAIQESLPISDKELAMLETSRGIPYHDPELCWPNRHILRHRQATIEQFKAPNR